MGSWATSEWAYKPHRYPHYQEGPKEPDSGTLASAARQLVQSFEEKEPCDQPRNRDQADLCAQWRAADAAEQAAQYAWWQIVISILGVIGLGVTLWFTRAALKTSHDLIDLEKKPFLVIRPIGGKKLKWSSWNDEPWHILFKIENVGRGPAIVKAIYRSWWVCAQYNHPDHAITFRDDFWKEKPVEIVVGPNSQTDTIDSFSWRLWKRHPHVGEKSWVSFHGYIRFEDLAGRMYESGFLYVFRLDQPERGLHLALPEKDASEYNYHRPVDHKN